MDSSFVMQRALRSKFELTLETVKSRVTLNKAAFLQTVIQSLQDVFKATRQITFTYRIICIHLHAERTNSVHKNYLVLVHLDVWCFTFDLLNFRILETPYEILKCQESWPAINSVNITKINKCQCNHYKCTLWLQSSRQKSFRKKIKQALMRQQGTNSQASGLLHCSCQSKVVFQTAWTGGPQTAWLWHSLEQRN